MSDPRDERAGRKTDSITIAADVMTRTGALQPERVLGHAAHAQASAASDVRGAGSQDRLASLAKDAPARRRYRASAHSGKYAV